MKGVYILKNKLLKNLAITTLIGVIICGCSVGDSVSADDGKAFLELYRDPGLSSPYAEYRDPDTGVHYYGNSSTLCPRYNADGSLYVD